MSKNVSHKNTHRSPKSHVYLISIHGIIICNWKGKNQYKGQALRDLSKILYCIYIIEYYADVKKDKVNKYALTLKNVSAILSEKSQVCTQTVCKLSSSLW